MANGGAEMCKPNAAGSCYAFDDAASTPTAAADSVQHRITEMVPHLPDALPASRASISTPRALSSRTAIVPPAPGTPPDSQALER